CGDELRNVVARASQLAGGIAVGEHAEGVVLGKIEQVGDLLENAREVFVLQRCSDRTGVTGFIHHAPAAAIAAMKKPANLATVLVIAAALTLCALQHAPVRTALAASHAI